jgi:hypothetical protein
MERYIGRCTVEDDYSESGKIGELTVTGGKRI